MRKLTLTLLLGLACHAVSAAMPASAGHGISPNQVQSATVAKTTSNSPPAMHEGVVTGFNLDKGEISIHGNLFRFDHATVRIFSASGGYASLGMLHKGEKIRFLLDPNVPSEKAISVIYLP